MTSQTTPERLAEIETIYGPTRPAIRVGLEELLSATDKVGIDRPSAIFGSADGELHAVWQGSSGRITAYVKDENFLVEVVPNGPRDPFLAVEPDTAAAYMRGVLTEF